MDINLDGTEISIIKALGLSGSGLQGEQLIERVGGLADAELLDALQGLISIGYVSAEKSAIHSIDDLKGTEFRVNSGYLRDLKEALDPRPKGKQRRLRRE